MGKFDGILICTDLDGTLFKNDKSISLENKEAIEFFKKEGGKFTFVTGRMPFYISDTCEKVKPNAPFGCNNGGGLYDSFKNEYLWTSNMSGGFEELIECIEKELPDVGIVINTFYEAYFCKENSITPFYRKITNLPQKFCDYKNVKEPVAKVVFLIEKEEDVLEIKKRLDENPASKKFDFVRTEKYLYEMLPGGIGKGTAIVKLAEYLNIDINKTIAIGDYDNDISMFKAAKVGIAVSNACEAALKAADFTTVSNEEHAIAQVIYDLENGKYLI
ncbi:MAG: HAD family phosphatase [Clostridia bacterium]|nr:HAD family phosphatase [Clostridia bacterium]